jgi:hypothetical protein
MIVSLYLPSRNGSRTVGQEMIDLDITAMAQRAGIPASTLRCCEEKARVTGP